MADSVFGPADDTSVTLHGKSMKSYDPNFFYKSPYGHKLTPLSIPRKKSQKSLYNEMHASPYILSTENLYTFEKKL